MIGEQSAIWLTLVLGDQWQRGIIISSPPYLENVLLVVCYPMLWEHPILYPMPCAQGTPKGVL